MHTEQLQKPCMSACLHPKNELKMWSKGVFALLTQLQNQVVVSNVFIFIPTWGNEAIWLIFFKGVETTN